ncbi:(2Fe-2S)-binding protein [Elioraea sp.]|uniref:(2Fe-2S)-binding protein n=1 Tax=Elioraea sp. TaxID=2185103 RepID=UPI003F718D78
MTADQTSGPPRWRRIARPKGRAVSISVDGEPVAGHEGESLAMALAAAGLLALRRSPGSATPRSVFCLMGVCQECAVTLDGVVVASCQEPVRDGMRVDLGALAPARHAPGRD